MSSGGSNLSFTIVHTRRWQRSRCIVAGPDGALWFSEISANKIGRISTAGAITEFPVTRSASGNLQCLAAGPDGAIWYGRGGLNGSGGIGRITTTGAVTEFPAPNVSYITTGPDGALWFTETDHLRIGRMTTTGAITEYAVPNDSAMPAGTYLQGIAVGPDHALWFTDGYNNAVGRISMVGVVTEYPVPNITPNNIGQITAAPDGALWFLGGASPFYRACDYRWNHHRISSSLSAGNRDHGGAGWRSLVWILGYGPPRPYDDVWRSL